MTLLLFVSPLRLLAALALVWSASSGLARPVEKATSASAVDALTEEQRAFTVEKVSGIVGDNYLFPEVANELAAHLKNRWQDGAYSKIDSMERLAELLTSDLQSVSGDKHLTLAMGHEVAVTKESMQVRRQRLLETNHGFNKVERLPGNIGYLEITEFCPPESAGAAMRRSFASLDGSDALIIDLRTNKGGNGDLIPLICGYFFPEPTHLYDIVNPRTGEAVKISNPSEGVLHRMPAIPIYVLTSRSTYSAAECLAYTLQSFGKATVVGEKTAGGAHPTRSFVIRELEIVVTVPVRNMLNPVTGTNWEGAGVQPDFEVPADLALEHAMKLATACQPD